MPPPRPEITLAQYLERELPDLSPSARSQLIRSGKVIVNHAAARTAEQTVGADDRIVIRGMRRLRTERAPSAPSARSIGSGVRAVFEDNDVIVLDKPTGLITASPEPTNERTLFDVVKEYLRQTTRRVKRRTDGPRQSRVAWVIHRLDKEVSGLVVFAKSERAYAWLKEDLRAKRIDRRYVAVVEGVLGDPGATGTFQSVLIEANDGAVRSISSPRSQPRPQYKPRPGKRPQHDAEGRIAITHYRVHAVLPPASSAERGYTVIDLKLDTGRKHQIRVHLAEAGHPILGDRKYGSTVDPLGRIALHARELILVHPRSGASQKLTSPAPDSFYSIAKSSPPFVEPEPTPAPAARPPSDTSWNNVAGWYDDLLDEKSGMNDHYREVIIPGALRLLEPAAGATLLDVACGQGVLCRECAALGMLTTGVDAAEQLVVAAQRRAKGSTSERYLRADARELAKIADLKPASFDAAACTMALANIDPLEPVFAGIARALKPGGRFVAIIAHPAFRAPDQTSWGWDDKTTAQYRRVDGYLSHGQKAVEMHPGKAPGVVTWTFHRPLQTYVRLLADYGFAIDRLEEWPSLRASTSGPRAAEENRARREIPLFLGFRAIKVREP